MKNDMKMHWKKGVFYGPGTLLLSLGLRIASGQTRWRRVKLQSKY